MHGNLTLEQAINESLRRHPASRGVAGITQIPSDSEPLAAAGFDPYEARIMPKRTGGGRWTTNSQGGQSAKGAQPRDSGPEHQQKILKAKPNSKFRPGNIHQTQDPKPGDVVHDGKNASVVTSVTTDAKGVKTMHLRSLTGGGTKTKFVAQGVTVIGTHPV